MRTRSCVVTLLVLAVSCLWAQAPSGLPAPVVPAPFGVNIHFVTPNAQEVELLAAGGFRMVRMDFAWAGVEKTPGVYDFAGYDKLVAALAARSIRLLFILDYGNPLYGGDAPHTDEQRAAFARFAAAAARQYAGQGILWEIWNEPNLAQFWKPAPSPEDYARLVGAVIPAMRQADPRAFIIGPASSGFPWTYFTVLGERGALAQFDAITVHPYRQSNPESAEADYLRLRALLNRYSPNKHLPILSGEWGYSTAWNGLSEERQGQVLARQWLVNLAHDVRMSIWYDWRNDGEDPKEPEHNFGTVKRDFTGKPAYQAAKTLAETLKGYRFIRRIPLADPQDYLLLFSNGEAEALAAWTTGTAHPLPPLAGPRGTATLVSMTGQRQEISLAGTLTLTVDSAPQYLLLPGMTPARRLADWRPEQTIFPVQANGTAGITLIVDNATLAASGRTFLVRAGDGIIGAITAKRKLGATQTVTIPLRYPRLDQQAVPVVVEENTASLEPLRAARVTLLVSNTIRLTPLPTAAKTPVPVLVENPSGRALTAVLTASAGAVTGKAPLRLAAGQMQAVIAVPLPGAHAPEAVSVQGTDAKGTLLYPPVASRWTLLTHDLAQAGDWTARLDGDPKIPAIATAQVVAAPEPPQPGLTHAVRVDYRFALGWRFTTISPPAALAPMVGQPREVGLWVYGDGSGHLLRCRFVDATGQTFQPQYDALTWQGWRFTRAPLTGEIAHWGGAHDGVIHYPIRWDAIALIDSNRQHVDTDGRVYLAGMAVGY